MLGLRKGSFCLDLTLAEQTRTAPLSFQREVVEKDSGPMLQALRRLSRDMRVVERAIEFGVHLWTTCLAKGGLC